MNLKIFIATHKKFDVPKSKYHVPLHVGREGKEDLGYLGDNTGDNISLKNPNYCELTGLYWIWKNVKDADYIGLCHYRRYFLKVRLVDDIKNLYKKIEKKIKTIFKNDLYTIFRGKKVEIVNIENEINKFEKDIEKNIGEFDIILLKKFWLSLPIKTHYKIAHIKEDLEILERVLFDKYPEYKESYEIIMKKNQFSACNMFIMDKKKYDSYMVWIFDILFEVEKRIEISRYAHQARVFGFMSERLLNVYVHKNKMRVKYYEMGFVDF